MTRISQDFIVNYGPWAVVTGASDGIGAAFSVELAALGLNLVLVARREDRLLTFAEELRKQFDVEVKVQPVDLSDKSDAKCVLTNADELDVGLLVAAAGFGSSGPALLTDDRTESDLVEVNCSAVLQQTLYFGRRMAARRRGGLVLLSSLLAFQGTPFSANYAASKAYIQALAEGLGAELKAFGVDVLSVAPGPIASGFAARANMRLGLTMTPEVVARVAIAALGRKRTVRPGWLSKLLGWGLSTTPRFLRVHIMGGIMGGMTKHQRSGTPARLDIDQPGNGNGPPKEA